MVSSPLLSTGVCAGHGTELTGRKSPCQVFAEPKARRRARACPELAEGASPRGVVCKKRGAKTLDALHLGSALAFQAATGSRIPFITADIRQRDAARRLDLTVVWIGSAQPYPN